MRCHQRKIAIRMSIKGRTIVLLIDQFWFAKKVGNSSNNPQNRHNVQICECFYLYLLFSNLEPIKRKSIFLIEFSSDRKSEFEFKFEPSSIVHNIRWVCSNQSIHFCFFVFVFYCKQLLLACMIVAAWAAPAPSPSPGTFYTSDNIYPLASAYSALGAPAYYSAPISYAAPYSYNTYAYGARPYYAYSSSILLWKSFQLNQDIFNDHSSHFKN